MLLFLILVFYSPNHNVGVIFQPRLFALCRWYLLFHTFLSFSLETLSLSFKILAFFWDLGKKSIIFSIKLCPQIASPSALTMYFQSFIW